MIAHNKDVFYPTFDAQVMFFDEVKEVMEERGITLDKLIEMCAGNKRIGEAARGHVPINTNMLERIAYELDMKLVICLMEK